MGTIVARIGTAGQRALGRVRVRARRARRSARNHRIELSVTRIESGLVDALVFGVIALSLERLCEAIHVAGQDILPGSTEMPLHRRQIRGYASLQARKNLKVGH